MKTLTTILLCGAAILSLSGQAFAWGATGHHDISELGIRALPAELPAFLHTEDVAFTIGELGREPDRWKGSGTTHDKERDPAHYLDLDDAEKVMGGPALAQLGTKVDGQFDLMTREGFDTEMRKVGKTQYASGYLYYALVDGYQQLRKDFGYWRVLVAAEKNATDPAVKARFARDRQIREMEIIHNIGTWSHYVADASMPLHLSIHYNGWTKGAPNPEGFIENGARPRPYPGVHAQFEGVYVNNYITVAMIEAKVAAPTASNEPVEERIKTMLDATYQEILPLYRMDKTNAFDTQSPAVDGYISGRMAKSVEALRDLIVMAWNESETQDVGYPVTNALKIEAGEDPAAALWGLD